MKKYFKKEDDTENMSRRQENHFEGTKWLSAATLKP